MTSPNNELIISSHNTAAGIPAANAPASSHHHRPTEGQLRWAQFHHKRNAQFVQERVERLWLHPASVADVPGALPEDGNDDNGDEDDEGIRSSRRRSIISSGRRAMLKVSQRQFVQRKLHIAEHGYFWNTIEDNTVEDDDLVTTGSVVSSSSLLIRYNSYTQQEHDALAEIFAEEHFRNNQMKRRRQKKISSEKDRVRRFEAAFYALLHSLQKQQDNPQTKIRATKRWERPETATSGANDGNWNPFPVPLKMSATQQGLSMRNSDKMAWMTTPDRSASWLVHLPAKAARYQKYPSRSGDISDETREQLTLVARQFLNQSLSANDIDNNNNSNTDVGDGDDDDVATLVDELLEQHGTDENSVKNMLARFESPSWIHPSPTSNPSLDATTPATLAISTEERCDHLEPPQYLNSSSDSGFVKQFVEQLEAACRHESLVTVDGKLHKPTFARLLQCYLEQCNSRSSKSNKSSPNSATTSTNPQATTVSLVRTLLYDLERGLLPVETMLSAEGTLSTSTLQKVVERYLDAAGATEAFVPPSVGRDPAAVLETLTTAPQLVVVDPTIKPHQTTATPPTSKFLRRIRSVREKVNRYRLGAEAVTEVSTTTLEERVESAVQQVVMPSGEAETLDTEKLNDSQSTAVSNKVGELFHSLHDQQRKLDTMTEPEQAGLKEYSAFRQRNSHNPPDDGSSSLSSFRVLPAGLRRVVERVRGSAKLSPRGEQADGEEESDSEHEDINDDAGSEHKRMDSLDYAYSNEQEPLETSMGDTDSGFLSSSHDRFNTTANSSVFSSEKMNLRGVHAGEQGVIDTDQYSDGTGTGIPVGMVASLMLSPTILTKRHQQAIRAVENRKWDQVMYLLSANPWLAEMADLTTNQYILHKLAFFGAGDTDGSPAAPEKLNADCVRMFPSAVHKFDKDGDLPLHMAAASANAAIIQLVGDRFPSGASVRNEDGMLPLHLAILACASMVGPFHEKRGREIVNRLIGYFPGSLAVVDNEGNLPIHTAASVLHGEIGASIVYLLIDEAEKQIDGPAEMRFRTKRTTEEIENASLASTVATDCPTDSSNQSDDTTNCLLVRNELKDTPLATAVYAGAGWEIIEALTCKDAALQSLDADANNSLHLLVSEQYKDPAAALAILKLVPEVATMRNGSGMLPIEIACMQCPVPELILALVLVDLPIDLDRPKDIKFRDGFGASWWYVACECDDFYSDIVGEVVSLCSYSQVEALSTWTNKSQGSLLDRATPKSRAILSSVLRFAGRFEIVGSRPSFEDVALCMEEYHALDYGPLNDPLVDGRRVLLRCFTSESAYRNETAVLQDLIADQSSFEDIVAFTIDASGQCRFPRSALQRFFIAIERPDLTLSGVVRGMLGHHDCQNDMNVRQRYTIKVFSVLRRIAKCLQRLHGQGFVHGDICLSNCGKFDGEWKLSDVLGAQRIGLPIEKDRLSSSAPPEAVEEQSGVAVFRSDLLAHPSLDSWAFGKLAFEVIVGDKLIEFDKSLPADADHASLDNLCNWSQSNVQHACQTLERFGVVDAAISMIAGCLSPNADTRPCMGDILNSPGWEAFRR